ncbi:hypothetical protein XANCAGTX0491_009540 [Xanthoria calcicola]
MLFAPNENSQFKPVKHNADSIQKTFTITCADGENMDDAFTRAFAGAMHPGQTVTIKKIGTSPISFRAHVSHSQLGQIVQGHLDKQKNHYEKGHVHVGKPTDLHDVSEERLKSEGGGNP